MNFVENIPCIPRYHVTDTGEVYRKNEYTSKTGLIYNKPKVKEVQILTMVSIQLD